MLTRALVKHRHQQVVQASAAFSSFDITNQSHKASAEQLNQIPKAPINPYRKRPVKLDYDKNEYWSFRLPSEDYFLLGSFDRHDLFGKRKGIEHSPHIRAQLNLDNKIIASFAGLFLVMAWFEIKNTDQTVTLRENYRKSDMGKFEISDFK